MAQGFWIQLKIIGRFDREIGRWIAGSPDLEVWSSGNTPQEAIQRGDEAIGVFIEEAYRAGTLNRVLAQCGVEMLDEAPVGAKPHPVEALMSAVGSLPGYWPFIFQIPSPKICNAG